MDTLLRDVRQALRALRARPAFALTAILTLTFGIGASGAIFSVLDAVLLRPLPYQAPEALVSLYESNARAGSQANNAAPASAATFRDWRDRSRSFAAIAAYGPTSLLLTGGEPERLTGTRVSGSLFGLLGAAPHVGRVLSPTDDEAGAPPTAMLSYRLWQRRFGGDPAIVGQSVMFNGSAHTIVGVAQPGFRFPDADSDVWTPFQFTEESWTNRGSHYLRAVARLAPGVTMEQANADMAQLTALIQRETPELQSGFGFTMMSLTEDLVGDVRPTLVVLGGAVAVLMLIACANVANLLLAHAAGRRREIAVRSALGATRGRIARQLLVESLVLAAIAGALGVLVAMWGTDLLVRLAPVDLPRLDEAAVNPRTFLFTFGIALATGVLFGLAPALHASRVTLVESLKDGTRGTSSGKGRARGRSLLLIGEVALSLVLLVGAGLLLRSFVNLRAVDPGFRPEQIMTARVSLSPAVYDSGSTRIAFFDRLRDEVAQLPGVRQAAFTSSLPLSGANIWGYWVASRGAQSPADVDASVVVMAGPGYLEALGVPLRAGRLFDANDREGQPPVMLVNEAMARLHFPGEEVIGQRIRPGDPESTEFEVVGIVGDVRAFELTEDSRPQMYLPYAQASAFIGSSMRLVVSAEGDPSVYVPAIREAARRIDGNVPVSDVRPLSGVLSDQLARTQFTLLLLVGFAGVALLLAVVGMYGVIAYSVTQRTQEFGIRMALGASRRAVLTQVLGDAMRTAGAGLVLGLAITLVAGRFVTDVLYDVTAWDPPTLVVLTILVSAVALGASAIPALRATRVAPSQALRAG